jgi:uncharacterized membrane protein YedE/YeeE
MLIDIHAIQMAVFGGLLIGGAASLMMLTVGRVTGISGIVNGVLAPKTGDTAWRLAFLTGLLIGGILLAATLPTAFATPDETRTLGTVIAAGLFVGFGVSMGSGCTSGHGVCGISRLSIRSLVATCSFMATGFATATGIQILAGGVL